MAKKHSTGYADYNKKQTTSVNFNEKTLTFLRYLKREKYILSISEGVRQMVAFAMPYFFSTMTIIGNVLEEKLENFKFKVPSQMTLIELRTAYPNIIDYKYINEDL